MTRPAPRHLASKKASTASPPTALDEAQRALELGEWENARAGFERAVRQAPSAAAWEGLGTATSYVAQVDVALEAREHAFLLYREARDARGAVRCALWLANDVMEFRGDAAVANGWLQRAQSILAEVVGPSPEGAHLLVFRAHKTLLGDSDSVASIAGGILGAMYPSTVNERWCEIVETVNHHGLSRIGDELARRRRPSQAENVR